MCNMRDMLILCAIGALSAAAWTATAGEGPSVHGAMHGSPGRGFVTGHMGHSGHHVGSMGIFFPVEPAQQFMQQLPGSSGPAPTHFGMSTTAPAVFEPEHIATAHAVGPAIHPLEHVGAPVEARAAVIPRPAAVGAADSDQAGAATAQPNPPTARPSASRPPGASVRAGRCLVGPAQGDQARADRQVPDRETGVARRAHRRSFRLVL